MIHVSIPLSADAEAALKARVVEGGHADLAEYLRLMIEEHVFPDDDWDMTPELAAALETGERSGVSPRSFDEIITIAKREAGLR